MAVVIVAIPRPGDPVWKISSEKIPHMTLLMLGDNVDNIQRVTDFVGHAADSLNPFFMDVDRRGVLGEQKADVLYFGKYYVDRLEDFRRQLLTNVDIFKAYQASDQFPEWVPHLTLGYPETPAKPDTRDYPGLYTVNFDRIALWTGDFEGVEFPLKREDNAALSMKEEGKAFLAHYGVKGMHWGVRRDRSGSTGKPKPGAGHAPSEDASNAKHLKDKGRNSGRDALSNKDLQTLVTRWNLEQQYERLRPRSPSEQVTKFVADLLISVGKEQVQQQGRAQINDLIKKSAK